MAKRASIASGLSARAENRKAFSGGSGLTCACAGNPLRRARANKAPRVPNSRSRTRSFLGDPFKILGQSIADGDSDDFGKFVRMMAANRRFQPRVQRREGLDRQGNLFGGFDLAAPVIK